MGVNVTIDAPDFELDVMLGDGSSTPDKEIGWEEVERPNDTSMTTWVGSGARREEVPILLDGHAEGRGVEKDLAKIESLTKRDRTGKRDKGRLGDPPKFRVRGPIHLAGRLVVLEALSYGEAIRRKGDMVLLRQPLTMTLMEYEREDRVRIGRAGKRTYTVKEGDTLRKIAAKLKPNASQNEQHDYAKELGKLNDIRDLRKRLRAGTTLRLP